MKLQNGKASLFVALLLFTGVQAYATESSTGYQSPNLHMSTGQANHSLIGSVEETMNSEKYTYVLLNTGKQKIWAAGPITKVKAGDTVSVSSSVPSADYHDKTLKRDFKMVFFSNKLAVINPDLLKSSNIPPMAMHPKIDEVSVSEIKKVKNGNTIAEIYKMREKLAGKKVRVRGKVIKYAGNIGGNFWLHILDASTKQDLLVLSKNETSLGAVVVVEGTVKLNKDNGIGHVYEVALEDATISDK